MTRYLDSIPEPWSAEAIREAIYRSFTDARASIEGTDGAQLWFELSNLSDTAWILESSAQDLLDEICLFGDHSKSPDFWNKTNRSTQDQYARRVKKRLFQCTSAVMALVDHTRNFQKKYPIDNAKFDLRRSESFGLSGLHDFLQGLRNYNTHWQLAAANWVIKHDFEHKQRTAHFIMQKADLLLWSGWSKKAKAFINSSADTLDLYSLFFDYKKKAHDFQTWYRGEVMDKNASTLRTYFIYKLHHDRCNVRTSWNFLLSHIPNNINLYQFLHRYLSQEQIEYLLSYEYKSPEQISKLIEMLDFIGASDENLRVKASKLILQESS